MKGPLSQIRVSLVASLGAGQIIFLSGIGATENKVRIVKVYKTACCLFFSRYHQRGDNLTQEDIKTTIDWNENTSLDNTVEASCVKMNATFSSRNLVWYVAWLAI